MNQRTKQVTEMSEWTECPWKFLQQPSHFWRKTRFPTSVGRESKVAYSSSLLSVQRVRHANYPQQLLTAVRERQLPFSSGFACLVASPVLTQKVHITTIGSCSPFKKKFFWRYKLGATLHSQMAGTSGSRPLEMNAVVSNLQFTDKLGKPSADKWAPKLPFLEG